MKSKLVDKNSTFQARIDRGWWRILSQLRTDTGKGFKELIEDALVNTYCIGKDGKPEIFINHIKAKNNSEHTRN